MHILCEKKIKIALWGLLRKLWECKLGVRKIDTENIKINHRPKYGRHAHILEGYS